MKFNLFNKQINKDKTNYVEAVIDNIDYSTNDNDFKLIFNNNSNYDTDCQVISFGDSTKSKFTDSLIIYKNNEPIIKLNFQYAYQYSYQKEALKFDRFKAIGLSGFFYLYDLSTETIRLFIDFNGYFDGLKISNQHLLVSYYSGIYCLTKFGEIKWHNNSVGIDGIIITEIDNDKIFGSEQIDPPDGWNDFILDFETGKRIK